MRDVPTVVCSNLRGHLSVHGQKGKSMSDPRGRDLDEIFPSRRMPGDIPARVWFDSMLETVFVYDHLASPVPQIFISLFIPNVLGKKQMIARAPETINTNECNPIFFQLNT